MKRFQYFLVIFLLSLISINVAAQSGELISINGIVKDQKSHHELEYVNVVAVGTNQGTVTNTDGIFTLKVRGARIIEFSYIGYQTVRLSIESLKQAGNVIYLKPKSVLLNEVVVSPVDAAKIVAEAVKRIPANYNNYPSMLTGFYRETIQKKKKFINITEAITNAYKTPYTEDIDLDRLKIFKGRKLVSPKLSDTLAVKLEGGPNAVLFLDMIKNKEELLDESSRQDYDYSFVDYISIDGRNHYAIRFKPNKITEYPLYEGVIYIDQDTYTISRMEFRADMSDPLKVTHMILKKKPAGLIFKPSILSYLVDYRMQDGKSYLNYIRSDIKFKCDWHKKLFHTSYAIVSEMVMTDRENNPTNKINYRDSFKDTQILSDKVTDFYDPDFWGDYNIIEPTESLENAVLKLKKSYDKLKNQ
jgi:hypothetical protein